MEEVTWQLGYPMQNPNIQLTKVHLATLTFTGSETEMNYNCGITQAQLQPINWTLGDILKPTANEGPQGWANK